MLAPTVLIVVGQGRGFSHTCRGWPGDTRSWAHRQERQNGQKGQQVCKCKSKGARACAARHPQRPCQQRRSQPSLTQCRGHTCRCGHHQRARRSNSSALCYEGVAQQRRDRQRHTAVCDNGACLASHLCDQDDSRLLCACFIDGPHSPLLPGRSCGMAAWWPMRTAHLVAQLSGRHEHQYLPRRHW